MNHFSPDQMYDVIQARHEDIRNAEAARRAAGLAKGNTPNRFKAAVNSISIFAKRMTASSANESAETTVTHMKHA